MCIHPYALPVGAIGCCRRIYRRRITAPWITSVQSGVFITLLSFHRRSLALDSEYQMSRTF
jgi:hypothetical protein